jgi:ADP-heptose:LPS heptosyltransferase
MLWSLRKRRIDCVILASPGYQPSAERLARFIHARQVVGFDNGSGLAKLTVPSATTSSHHQVENVFRMLKVLGIDGPPPPLRVVPDAARVSAFRSRLPQGSGPVVGVHISARESDRRWPDAKFAELITRLTGECGARVALNWAPGAHDRRDFPGDDDSAQHLCAAVASDRLIALPTRSLADLIACLAICDYVICSDGGPVHIASALNKPVVCFFGSERQELWHPWKVPYRLLQPPSRNVADISVDEAVAAFVDLSKAA